VAPLDPKVLDLLIDGIKEVKEGLAGVHRRLDEIVNKDFVSRKECESYRKSCPRGGIPPWVTLLSSIASSLIAGLLMYSYTSAQYLKQMQALVQQLGK